MPTTSPARKKAAERWALPASQARSRATRERLLAAGEQVFAREGYDGARLADIAEEAGCSVGAVYFRFKDKDALFFAIAEAFADQARADFAARMAAQGPRQASAFVRDFVTDVARTLGQHRGLFRAIVERGFDHPLAAETVFGLRDELAERLGAALGGVPAAKVRVMTQMVYGFLLASVLNRRAPTSADPAAVQELAKACVAYLESG